MSSPSSVHLATLSRRLDALTETYKQTLQSIHKIPRTPDPEDLLEVTSGIRDSLNSLSEDLDLLTLSLEDVGTAGGARPADDSEQSRQKLRLSVQAQRLGEDIKNARQSFRRTQIYAKKAEEGARRKERNDRLKQLREPPRTETPPGTTQTTPTSSQVLPSRRKKEEKLTEDDMLVHASGDVLDALRQTHALMASELERSQFAQEILNQSTRELEQLNESYTDLDTMLKTSKGLVTQLMKTNKSDTWYLTTARTFLLVVLAWLVWRRLLWGPTWWILWLPLKIMYMTLTTILSPFGLRRDVGEPGLVSSSLKVMPSASERPQPVSGDRQVPHIQVGRGGGPPPAKDPSKDGSLSQKVGRIIENAEKIVRGDGVELEDSDEPRNPKKRVMDTADEGLGASDIIDELELEHEQERQQVAEGGIDEDQVRDEL